MLAEDATLAMPPYPTWWRGRDTIIAVVASPGSPFHERWRYVPIRASGQLAAAAYLWDADKGAYRATGLDVLTVRGSRIAAITAFATPHAFGRFGVRDELPPSVAP